MKFKNPANGHVEAPNYIFLWAFLFGFFYFAVKGIWPHAVIVLVVGVAAGAASAGIGLWVFWFVYAFFAKGIVRNSYLKRDGWK